MEIDRTFRDGQGIEWRVSQVPADAPATPSDDGWLSFEHGHMERRLTPFPKNWQSVTLGRLEQMCRVATPIQRVEGYLSARDRADIDATAEPVVDATPAESVEAVIADMPSMNEHVSVLANAYPARQNRITFRG
ncbi:MAG TPA: hypothetical protein VGM82_11465 [Gemmatimonadaceae bacterium]|jgi:hypothetical protein